MVRYFRASTLNQNPPHRNRISPHPAQALDRTPHPHDQAYMPGVKSLVFLTRDLSPKIPRSLVILNQIPRVSNSSKYHENDKNLHYFSSQDGNFSIFSYLVSLILTKFIKIIHDFWAKIVEKTQKNRQKTLETPQNPSIPRILSEKSQKSLDPSNPS